MDRTATPVTCGQLVRKLSGKCARRKPVKRRFRKETPLLPLLLLGLLLGGLGLLLERSAKDVAKRRTRIRRSVLRNRLLFLGDLKRLDGEVWLLRPIEADDHCVELLADLEAVGALLVAVTAKIAALDEAGDAVLTNLDVEPGVLNCAHDHGQGFALLGAAAGAAGRCTA